MRKEIHPISKMSQNPFRPGWFWETLILSPPPPHMHIFTACKRSCGKVMYLHLSVILFTGGKSLSRGVSVGGEGGVQGISVQGVSDHGDPPVWWKSGRYVSYWNAFLFWNFLIIRSCVFCWPHLVFMYNLRSTSVASLSNHHFWESCNKPFQYL